VSRIVILIVIALKAFLVPLPASAADDQPEDRSAVVERSLVAFSSPQAMLHPGTVAPADRLTLAERMKHYDIPGASVAIIDNNEIAWTKSYGVTKTGDGQAVNEETIFQAASTTKLIAAVATLKLVEDGVLDLDKDVNSYLRSWRVPDNEFTRAAPITLRLLLTHQAGLNRPDGGFDRDGEPTLVQTLNGEYPALSPPANVELAPGSTWQYSNYGYLIIQQIIEDATQQSFNQVVSELILEPVGMDRSTFDVPLSAELRQNEALPHDAEGITRDPFLSAAAVANGGLRTTPTDLAKFTVALIDAYAGRSDRMLTQESAANLFATQVEVPAEVLGLPLQEGLGVLLSGQGEGRTFLHPGDNQPGASCWLSGVTSTGQGVIVMTNGIRGNLLAMEVLAAVSSEYAWPRSMIP